MSIGSRTHEEFMEEARAFHGYPAPGLIIGGYMVELAKRHMPEGVLYDAISETAHCLPDAVQLLTPCTVGNGWLRVLPFGIYAVTLYDKRTGEGVRVHLDNDKLGPYDEIRCWFLKERPKGETGRRTPSGPDQGSRGIHPHASARAPAQGPPPPSLLRQDGPLPPLRRVLPRLLRRYLPLLSGPVPL